MADEEKKEELELTELTEEVTNTEESTESAESQDSENNNIETEEEFVKKDKTSLIKKILIGVISLLLIILLAGVVSYLLGFFDEPEPEPEIKVQTEKTVQSNINQQDTEDKEYKFDISDINSKKLNKQLELLTNKHIQKEEKNEELEKLENEKKILEEEKKKHQEALAAEEKKLSEEKELLEAKKNELEMQKNELEMLKQEALTLKEQLEKDKEILEKNISLEKENIIEEYKNEDIIAQNENLINKEENIVKDVNNDNPFLLLINVAKIKGELYKNYLDRVVSIDPNISLCRDDKNRIEIYYGPFTSNEERKILFQKLLENSFKESYEVELTKEEFSKRCKY